MAIAGCGKPGCKWCAQGECWGSAKGKGGGGKSASSSSSWGGGGKSASSSSGCGKPGCKWCAQGQCWGSAKGKGGGGKSASSSSSWGGGKSANSSSGCGKPGCKWCAVGQCWSSGKGKGKGFSPYQSAWKQPSYGNSWGKGKKGKGKGKFKKPNPSLTVWVGSIPEGSTYTELKAHVDEILPCKWAEVFRGKGKGTGLIGFSSNEEKVSAITMLNGSVFKGAAIEVDEYAKAPQA